MPEPDSSVENAMTTPPWTRWVGPLVGVALFAAALFVMGHELRHVRWADVAAAIATAAPAAILAAFLALAASRRVQAMRAAREPEQGSEA